MFLEHENTYCVLGGKVINTIVFWATNYCVMTDRLLCYGRPARSEESIFYKALRGVFCLANHYITIYITMRTVDNSKERLL